VFLGIRKSMPRLMGLHQDLAPWVSRYEKLVQDHAYQFKKISYKIQEKIVTRGAIHARLADMAMWLHASACVLSKLDRQMRNAASGPAWERDHAAGLHFLDMAEHEYQNAVSALFRNPDDTMALANQAALAYSDTLPNANYVLPERSPNAMGQGKTVKKEFVKQFPGVPA
jgi:hypothetical protein